MVEKVLLGIVLIALAAVVVSTPQTATLIQTIGTAFAQLITNVVGTGAKKNG